MPIIASTAHDMLVWALSIICIIATFAIALLGDDIGEPWASLILLALTLACAILTGLH